MMNDFNHLDDREIVNKSKRREYQSRIVRVRPTNGHYSHSMQQRDAKERGPKPPPAPKRSTPGDYANEDKNEKTGNPSDVRMTEMMKHLVHGNGCPDAWKDRH